MLTFAQFTKLHEIQSFDSDEGYRRKQKHGKYTIHDLGNKISTTKSGHDVYHDKPGEYYAVKNGKIHLHISGNKDGKSFATVQTKAYEGNTIKAHELYAHLIKHHKLILTSGANQSEGGKKIWQRLSKVKGINVHGWHKNEPININPLDDTETHHHDKKDKNLNYITKMRLVAHQT